MNGNEIVKELYETENENSMRENHSTSVTLRMSPASAAMLNAIAARFETSRYSLVEDQLNKFAKDAFLTLNDEDKEQIALVADKEVTEHMLKKGAKIKSVGIAGSFEDEWAPWRHELALMKHFHVEDDILTPKEGDE